MEEADLIEFSRNRGFQIVETKLSDVAQTFDMRLALEPRIAARAAKFRTPAQIEQMREILQAMQTHAQAGDEAVFFSWDKRLHDVILEAGGSTRAQDTLARLRMHTRILTHSTVRSERSLTEVNAQHLHTVEAIADGDAAALANAALLDARVEEIWEAHTGEF